MSKHKGKHVPKQQVEVEKNNENRAQTEDVNNKEGAQNVVNEQTNKTSAEETMQRDDKTKHEQKQAPEAAKDEKHEMKTETMNAKETSDEKTTTETDAQTETSIDTVDLLEAKVAKLEDDLLRERAELENFKRRTRQEYDNNLKYANQRLIEQLLPALDAFDRALSTQDTNTEATGQFLRGFEMIDSLLKQTLENAGLTVIPSVGEQFDPYLHQAVSQGTDESKKEDEILEELQKGYKLKDRVIRASMVKTNKK